MRLPRFVRPYGTSALLLEWEQRIDPAISASVNAYARALRPYELVEECVPAYASLLVTHRGGRQAAYALRELIFGLSPAEEQRSETVTHELPVCYGGEFGPDLEDVSTHCSLPPEEVIGRHTAVTYRVYFLGFQPGFGFLGELDASLEVPRRASPRTRVPAGSVGLAGRQTGIYPMDSPGGWQLIGRCPLPLLQTGPDTTRLRAGDRLRFYPITAADFTALQQAPLPWPTR
ncbi:5-oxoprolinase subunit PxpB [Neolewinella sp.]|uniref:5-oxoprolinase subunit PxpB n=1 Tax=Neolewinella sp. TaxID=2993543 RepID=UPI003B521AA2